MFVSHLVTIVLWIIWSYHVSVNSFTFNPTRNSKELLPSLQQTTATPTTTTTTTGVMNSRRVLLQSFLVITTTTTVPSPAFSKVIQPCTSLEDIREQLDLAVQASSVQALKDAKESINDSRLDEANLKKAFDLCPGPNGGNNPTSSLESTTIAINKFRKMLNQSSTLQTEDIMAAMQFGTNARSIVDAQLL